VRILIAGGSGYLGAELAGQAARAGHEVIATYHSSPAPLPPVRWEQLDVRRRDRTRELVAAIAPDVVLNAAYRYDDWATTADGAGHLAAAAQDAGAHLVHVSSDALSPVRPRPTTKPRSQTRSRRTAPPRPRPRPRSGPCSRRPPSRGRR